MDFDQIILFEPETYDNFYPFSAMHPVWELRCGALRLFEKPKKLFPKKNLAFIGRELHLHSFMKRFDLSNKIDRKRSLFIAADVIADSKFFKMLNQATGDEAGKCIYYKDKKVVAVCSNEERIDSVMEFLREGQTQAPDNSRFNDFVKIKLTDSFDRLEYLWDALDHNGDQIAKDLRIITNEVSPVAPGIYSGSHFVYESRIYTGDNVRIAPSSVIDASEGPVYIGDNVEIMPHSYIKGPVAIGANSKIKAGAKIYEDTSFGEWCKVGGEVENSIIQSYSNKQHEGFLGHSFLSEWINIGADTNTSDLKNTYDEIKLRIGDKTFDTGRMFLGLLCGDHTKSSINAMFTTGTVAGICGIVVREWFMPNYIKSFSWGGKQSSPVYKFEKALETAKKVMKRRSREITKEEIELMKAEYEKAATDK